MRRPLIVLITGLAPAIWGSTYIVTTELLPQGYPVTLAMLRALPAGLLLLIVARQLPKGIWWRRMAILGGLNFAVFWTMLFIAAYRLPGGVAATLGAVQPLIVVALAYLALGTPVRLAAVAGGALGIAGVAMLILGPEAALDPLGVAAGLAGATSMAAGTVLTRKWQPPVPLLTFTAWQLTAGGLLLLPAAVIIEPPLPPLTLQNWAGLLWLGLVGAALTYALWFRGIARLGPAPVSALGFLSPLTAVVLGWALLHQALTPVQIIGSIVVLGAVWLSQQTEPQGLPRRLRTGPAE